MAILLQFVAPLSWSFGLWLIYPTLNVTGNACLSCFLQISASMTTSATAIALAASGTLFFLTGIMLFVSGLGLLASNNNAQAERWLHWLGPWRPKWSDKHQELKIRSEFRSILLGTLFVSLLLAVLLIPGIGEDRQFPLNQFFDLWGTVWYFYVFGIGIAAFLLIYKKRPGGYVLSLILSLVPTGMNVPDLLGLLPPTPPTFGTSILLVAGLPFSLIGVYVSMRALRSLHA
ncbi:MAG TPA: hypothetical protein VF906_06500 [Candidatus Bathyarchaeia archaeon]